MGVIPIDLSYLPVLLLAYWALKTEKRRQKIKNGFDKTMKAIESGFKEL